MRLTINFRQMRRIDGYVSLRRRQRRMAQQFLNRPQVTTLG